MQYAVPQFVDGENKIFGPISVRQFILMALCIAVIFITYKLADVGLFILITVVNVAVTIVVAFVKINGRPFHYFILNFVGAVKTPPMRVWKKEISSHKHLAAHASHEKEETPIQYIKIAQEKGETRSRLSDLALLVDTGGYYHST